MSSKSFPARGGRFLSWAAGIASLVATWSAGPVSAQVILGPAPAPVSETSVRQEQTVTKTEEDPFAGDIIQTGCSSCGGGSYGEGLSTGGCRSCCYAGRTPCDCCLNPQTCVGKFFAGFYECVCCPDPCYVPRWLPIANNAFFVDSARPITHMRLRWDAGWNLARPDRAEFFMPRFGTTTAQVDSAGNAIGGVGKGPNLVGRRADYHELTLYNEAAVNNFGMSIEIPYRALDFDATTAPFERTASGFGDMVIGTKTLLLDCELMQYTLQFKTFLPTGNVQKGAGTGHVSLEPSNLLTLKCSDDCYIQAQTSLWIPIGGDASYQGNVFHQHYSINKVLCKWCEGPKNIQLIGSAELNHWYVINGLYTTDATAGGAPIAADASANILSVGPGVRLVLCNTIDFGIGSAFSLTGDHWAGQLIRSEFRWRF